MFVRLTVGYASTSSIIEGFLAKFHYGTEVCNEILGGKTSPQKNSTHKLTDSFHCS